VLIHALSPYVKGRKKQEKRKEKKRAHAQDITLTFDVGSLPKLLIRRFFPWLFICFFGVFFFTPQVRIRAWSAMQRRGGLGINRSRSSAGKRYGEHFNFLLAFKHPGLG
jgi:hypothetical protein